MLAVHSSVRFVIKDKTNQKEKSDYDSFFNLESFASITKLANNRCTLSLVMVYKLLTARVSLWIACEATIALGSSSSTFFMSSRASLYFSKLSRARPRRR